MIPHICIPNHTDNHYALTVKGSFTKRLYFEYGKGLLIEIVAKDDYYKYPCNLDVQIAQMDMIKESLISLIDGKYQPTDRDRAYHNLLIEKHLANKRSQRISSIPDGAVNLDLTILTTSSEPKLVQLEKMECVIEGKQYILGLKRGERIAVTKIANPKNVTTVVPDVPSVKASLDTPVNVMIVCSSALVKLRQDELYEITFRGLGENKVELFYLNQVGDVTHYGKLSITVHPNKEKYKDPRKQRLYEHGFEPGSYGYRPQYATLEEAKAAIGFDDKNGAITHTKGQDNQFETIVLEMPGLRANLSGYDKKTRKYLVRIDLAEGQEKK